MSPIGCRPSSGFGRVLGMILGAAAMAATPTKVIYETDMTFDVDDVGALAVLHALADRGEAELLAVCFNEVHPSGAAAIAAVNAWYRRSVPIGVYKGDLESPDASRYLEHVAQFPHVLEGEPRSALDVYRSVLAAEADGAVTIASVGFLNNLADLLRADRALVERKVRELVVMGGRQNDGFNFVRHGLVDETQFVLEHWPTPLVVSDFGGSVHTGIPLAEVAAENPVREAYFRWFNGSYRGRSSWDQIAVLYAVRGAAADFHEVTQGEGSLRNGYAWPLRKGWRTYIEPAAPTPYYADLIDALMVAPPRR